MEKLDLQTKEPDRIDVELALQKLDGVTAMLSAFSFDDGSHRHQGEAFFVMSEIVNESVNTLRAFEKLK